MQSRTAVSRGRRWLKWSLIALGMVVIAAVLGVVFLINSGWTRDRLRRLAIEQANRNLNATLEIGALSGSLLRDVRLDNVRIMQEGRPVVTIDEVIVSYRLGALLGAEPVVHSIRLTRPRTVAFRLPDGRWNLGALMRSTGGGGAGPTFQVELIEVVDGSIEFTDPLAWGPLRVPTRVDALNVAASVDVAPGFWNVDIANLAFSGQTPDFQISRLSGGLSHQDRVLTLDDISLNASRTALTVDGTIDRSGASAQLDLQVSADSFVFQDWAEVLPAIRPINVESSFQTKLTGPLDALATDIALRSTGGDARGRVVLNTRAPGWQGVGDLDVQTINLAPWLDRPERLTNLTGRIVFDAQLFPGRGLPRGTFTFNGARAESFGYVMTGVRARGRTTAEALDLAAVTGTAYGAQISIAKGRVNLDTPYAYEFTGSADNLDLRNLPATVPVPHVESDLAFDFEVRGQFTNPTLDGRALFADSTLLGAGLAAGTTGALDTTDGRFHYEFDGGVTSLPLPRVATDFGFTWLTDPRYAGTISGQFRAAGDGQTAATTMLTASGRLHQADNIVGGSLSDADVSIEIENGNLHASYDGAFVNIDPAIAFTNPELAASVDGAGQFTVSVQELMIRPPLIGDYTVEADITVNRARVRDVEISEGQLRTTLDGGKVSVSSLALRGPDFQLSGSGEADLQDSGPASFTYVATGVNLAPFSEWAGRELSGSLATSGQLSGSLQAPHVIGSAVVTDVVADDVVLSSASFKYDATLDDAFALATAHFDGGTTRIQIGERAIQSVNGTVDYDAGELTTDLEVAVSENVTSQIAARVRLDLAASSVTILAGDLTVQSLPWRLDVSQGTPTVKWGSEGITISRTELFDPRTGQQRIVVDGTWRPAGGGELHVDARDVFLDLLTAEPGRPAPYGGLLNVDAVVTGDAERPIVTGIVRITDGRVGRLSYDSLLARVEYVNGLFEGGFRLDQAPGVWLTATGAVPLSTFDRSLPEQQLYLSVTSSDVNLGLLEGITDVVRDVTGSVTLDLVAAGTSHQPRVTGTVQMTAAGFRVVPTGVRYQNGRASLEIADDQLVVRTLHIEDARGQTLDVTGSLNTQDFSLGAVNAEITARRLEVMQNTYGNVEVDARLGISGPVQSPRIEGAVTITGGELDVDRILDRVMFQPYATEAQSPLDVVDALRVLNPWERMGLGIELSVPGTIRMVGENLQVSPGTPLGLGDFNLRATGDLYLYKDPEQPLYVTGSLDQVTGAYSFQGRRFELDPVSSINFRGDLNPELYVTVRREISGVQTSVTIAGPLREPELRLTSTPPLDPSDILSLIVFNTSTNELSSAQQEQLAVRAGTLAAGFLASPLVTALERTLGLDTFEIEPGPGIDSGPRVTIGDEIAPGLVARFSRQFGANEYDEATIEYYLSRIFRIRATFSDVGSQSARSPFRRVERAGIDLLVFFSF